MSMFQRKVPQTLVYGVKQAIVRSQQQTKNAADGSDLLAMNNTVQQASSTTTTTTTTTTTNPTTTVVTSSTTTSTPSSIIDGVSDHMNSTTAIIAPTSSSSPSSSSSAAAVIGSGSGGAANVKIFINEVSNHGTVQLSNHFTIDAIANVSDAIVKAVGIDKLMEIASANLELPTIMLEEEEFITNYGSLDFSQEEFDMFTSSSLSLSHQLQYQSSVVVPVTSHTFSSSKSPLSSSSPTASKTAKTATASMDKQKSKIDASKMVSSKNSTVQFEDVTHNNHHVTTRRSALMSALTERIMSKFHQLISQLRQLLSWNSSMSTTTNSTSNSSSNNNNNNSKSSSSSSSPLLNHNGSGDSNEHQMRVRELTTLGVAFAAAYAIDVLLFRMMRNPLMSHAFRNSLMNTLKQV